MAKKSKRAEVFERILPFIEGDDWVDEGPFVVFGRREYYRRTAPLPDDLIDEVSGGPPAQDWTREFSALIARLIGARDARLRTELTNWDTEQERLFNDLIRNLPRTAPPGLKERLLAARTPRPAALREAEQSGEETRSPREVHDSIDAHYAREMIALLDRIVARTLPLAALAIGGAKSAGLKASFREANRCFLMGQRIACAVMCRAIIESSLVERCDPHGEVRRQVKAGESCLRALIDRAQAESILKEPLVSRARSVVTAGNEAAHDSETFERGHDSEDVRFLLEGTRAVVEMLFPADGA